MAAGSLNFSIEDHAMEDRQFIDHHNKGRVFLTLGAGTYIGSSLIDWWGDNPHLLIGRYCSISRHINILLGSINHDYQRTTTYPISNVAKKINYTKMPESIDMGAANAMELGGGGKKNFDRPQIIIGNDVWIGAYSTLISGVKIGNGAVIGSNSVVSKDIPPYAIAVGNPAKVIKYRFSEELIRKFQAIKWWNWSFEKIAENENFFDNAEEFTNKFYAPQLESHTEAPIIRQLSEQHNQGKKIYAFITDFYARHPLWKRILRGYISTFTVNDPVILVVFFEMNTTEEHISQMKKFLASIGISKDSPSIYMMSKPKENFSIPVLKQIDHFITTREISCLNAIDFLHDTNAKVISSLSGRLFPNEPTPIW